MVAWIDPSIRYINFTELSRTSPRKLEGLTAIIMSRGQPASVLIPYETYLELQALLELPKVRAAGSGKD